MENKLIELEKELSQLLERTCYFYKAFGNEVVNHSLEAKKWDRSDLKSFEEKINLLRAAKIEIDQKDLEEKPLMEREYHYSRIDKLLLEAIAEKEEGRPEKMEAYLIEREKIKKQFPKV